MGSIGFGGRLGGPLWTSTKLGSGVVDLFLSPILESRGKKRVLPNKAERLLAARLAKDAGSKTPKTWSALQTSWADWAQKYLDPALRRGRPKSQTLAEHLPPSIFRKRADEVAKREKEATKREHAIQSWWARFRADITDRNERLRSLVSRLLQYGTKMREKVSSLEDETRRQKDLIVGLARTIGRGAAAARWNDNEIVLTALQGGLERFAASEEDVKFIDKEIHVGRDKYTKEHSPAAAGWRGPDRAW